MIDGVADMVRIGISLAGAGDFDGDAVADVWIGAPFAIRDDAEPGQVYLLSGADLVPGTTIDVSSAESAFFGEADGDEAGWSVAAEGDYNGDGRTDLFTFAPSAFTDDVERGKAYLVFGR
jgi:hypothetical protein